MKLKSSMVSFKDLKAELLAYMLVFEECWKTYSGTPMVITSANDSVHGGTSGYNPEHTPPSNSKHYLGEAVDIRSHNVPKEILAKIMDMADEMIGNDVDFFLEAGGTENEHIHFQLG